MASTIFGNAIQQAATSIAFTSTTLSALANATFVTSTAALDLRTITTTAAKTPMEVWLTLEATPGTVSGNKQGILYVQISFDNSTFSTGPTSGTSIVDVGDLYQIGILPLATNTTLQRKSFPLFATLGGVVGAIKPVVFNDSGAAWTTGVLTYSLIVGDGT